MISKPVNNIMLVKKIVNRNNIDLENELKVPKLSKKDMSYLMKTIPLKERYEHPPLGFKGDRLQWLVYKKK